MPFPTYMNPNVIQPQVQQFPLPGSPAAKWMQLQMWQRGLLAPQQLQQQPGLPVPLDRVPYRGQPTLPSGLLQPAGDVIDPNIPAWKRLAGLIQQGEGLARSPLGPGLLAPGGAGNVTRFPTVKVEPKVTTGRDVFRGLLSPSAKDTAQTSYPVMPGAQKSLDALVAAGRKSSLAAGEKAAFKAFGDLTAKQAGQAERNWLPAWAKKVGIDPGKAGMAEREIRAEFANKGMSVTQEHLKFLIMVAHQNKKL